MSPKRRSALRKALCRHQRGKCCYCAVPLVMPRGPSFKAIEGNNPKAATFEHLHRRVDGGTHHPDNLALACKRCNAERGAMSWVEFKTLKSASQENA